MGSTNKIGGITTENWDSWDKHDDPFLVVSLVRNAQEEKPAWIVLDPFI